MLIDTTTSGQRTVLLPVEIGAETKAAVDQLLTETDRESIANAIPALTFISYPTHEDSIVPNH